MKNTLKYLAFALFGCLLILACGSEKKSNEPFGDCQYGAPKAVFKPEIPKLSKHSFQLNKNAAIEKVQFDNGIALELIQSGCEKPKQEFQFTIPASTNNFKDGDWINMGIDMFAYMGRLAPELQPFLMWQGALSDRMDQLKLGLPHELEQGFFVKLDKVAGGDSGLLLVTLYQE